MQTTEKIWQEYNRRLRAYIRRNISDDAATDDILQDIFLKVHTRLGSLKDEAKLGSWLYQVARNSIMDYYRSRKPTVELFEQLPLAEIDSREKALQEFSECLQPMVDRLPDNYREAVILSEIEGMPQRGVAERLGISLSGAKSRVQRGRAMLKEMLEECCHLEYDHSGRVYDYERKAACGCRPPDTDST